MTHLPEELARARRAVLLEAGREARRTRRARSRPSRGGRARPGQDQAL
ncbi:hypothetical protein [uncultured Nocardioides sp.]|nr:hypothetical protein [uncultured Nocardioides sp.]